MDISTAIQTSNLSQVASSSNSIRSNSLLAQEKAREKEGETPFAQQGAGESADKLTLSDTAGDRVSHSESRKNNSAENYRQVDQSPFAEAETDESVPRDPEQSTAASGDVLSEEDQRRVQELKRRDTEVRAHEQAHLSAAGNLSRGSASFTYETGPDGNRYAVGGEVNIDTSGVTGDPQATLAKAQKIRRAATAPADPSSQDRSVAAQASRMEAQARTDIFQQVQDMPAGQVNERSIDKETSETDFSAAQTEQNEKNIQNSYQKVQNSSVLEMPKNSVDFFI